MSKLYLFNYNNYFNRIIKRGVTLSDYGTPIYTLSNTNFDENDGVSATHTVNYNAYDGDYIVITDDKDVIKSRWFVVENKKQRGGQHTLNLRRDLIVDYYNQIITAPALINRAMINDPTNPLIFNSEGFSFNQIKKGEMLIHDPLKARWYVLYFKKNIAKISGEFASNDAQYDKVISGTMAVTYPSGTTYNMTTPQFEVFGVTNYSITNPITPQYKWTVYNNDVDDVTAERIYDVSNYSDMIWFDSPIGIMDNQLRTELATGYTTLKSALENDLNVTGNLITDSKLNELINDNGKLIKDSANKIYRLTVNVNTYVSNDYITTGTTRTEFDDIIENSGIETTGSYGDKCLKAIYTKKTIDVSYEEVDTDTIAYELDWGNYATTTDSEFNIVAIPYDLIKIAEDDNSTPLYDVDIDISQKLIDDISIQAGSNLVDIQIFPYCPYHSVIKDVNPIHLSASDRISSKQYMYIQKKNEVSPSIATAKTIVLFLNKSNFTFTLPFYTIDIPNYSSDEALNKKVSNEVDLYRMCSPNYNGIFEFSVAKNDGVSSFNVDASLIPYSPYLHINPDFKSLYGADFDDARGLICNGDFSLPKYSSEWANYMLNNKNYQNIFNRQIEHMDFEFSKARNEALFGATVGSIGAGLSGGVTGAMIGGPIGAGIGAGIGALTSAIGGAVDYNILKERQAESKDLAIDNFNYQLGNIKARPYSINKVTPLTYNNKKFPFVEWYSCTDTEINILLNKIKYNSMKVNAIGTIAEYLQSDKTYISASLIRLEELNVPTHEANEIYDEIMKGVYI